LRNPSTLIETDGQPDGFHDFLSVLRDQVIAFRKPVAYVHGDSHYFRIDKPFLNAQGRRLENFTRVETFGDNQGNGNNDVNWLKVVVDSDSREAFFYQPQIVPANRTASTRALAWDHCAAACSETLPRSPLSRNVGPPPFTSP
jgi:hypothetical protein